MRRERDKLDFARPNLSRIKFLLLSSQRRSFRLLFLPHTSEPEVPLKKGRLTRPCSVHLCESQ
jgi:hypothetical protein